MQAWEYQQVFVKRSGTLEVLTARALDPLGVEGWELVSSFPERDHHGNVTGAWYTLKRSLGS